MAILKHVGRGGVLALGISLVAVLALVWGQVNSDGAQADADGPAMSLGAPAIVYMGETFVVTVTADPAPDENIAGFGSEIIAEDDQGVPDRLDEPEGLESEPRASCADELQVERADGGAIALCNSFSPILTGGAAHAVLTEFIAAPALLDVAQGSTTLLLELDFVCNTAGSYTLILTAVPDSPDGALFAGPSGGEIAVKTVDGIADTLTIECSDEPPPTDTPEPTDIPPEPTDVPPEPTATDDGAVGPPDTGVGGSTGDGGSNAGLWVLIGAMLAASVAGMTAFGWRYVRVR